MKLKDFFKEAVKKGALITAQKARPVYQRNYIRIRSFIQKKPKTVVVGMLLFATLNFVLMVYMVNRKAAASLVPSGIGSNSTEGVRRYNSGAKYTVTNFLRISRLKDSLDYLIKKPTLSRADSLLFIRICEEYSNLDPSFFEQVNQSINKNLKSKNHEETNRR